jgi:site-specific DNA recombinase
MQPRGIIPIAAIYARVSTEDQAERQTVQAQLDFLRRYCDLHALPIAGEYIDDGISGAKPLATRPEGARLLADAEAGQFSVVLVYRLDRLGRSLTALLSAHEQLERADVAIKSATEPFDTSSPIGKFLFQLLGSLAELERSTITERMTMGRDRVARQGKYTGGPIPFGYDVEDGCLVPSPRLLDGTGMTEAEYVTDLFARIAQGSTVYAEAQRLNALGVVPCKRYAGGKVVTITDTWSPPRVAFIVHNPAYKGEGRLNSRTGAITRPAPVLVDADTWERVQHALTRNRRLSKKNAKRTYLLRGLIVCGNCGFNYSGATWRDPKGRAADWPHYECNGKLAHLRPKKETRCTGRAISGTWLESLVWDDCAAWIRNPGERLAEAQRQLRDRLSKTADHERQRQTLLDQLAEKEHERERVLSMYRRGRISEANADQEFDAIDREMASLRRLLDSVDAQEAMTAAAEAHLATVATSLAQLQDEVDEIERIGDRVRMRGIIDLLVGQIVVQTEPGELRKRKSASVAIRYHFESPQVLQVDSSTEPHPSSRGCRHARPGGRPDPAVRRPPLRRR